MPQKVGCSECRYGNCGAEEVEEEEEEEGKGKERKDCIFKRLALDEELKRNGAVSLHACASKDLNYRELPRNLQNDLSDSSNGTEYDVPRSGRFPSSKLQDIAVPTNAPWRKEEEEEEEEEEAEIEKEEEEPILSRFALDMHDSGVNFSHDEHGVANYSSAMELPLKLAEESMAIKETGASETVLETEELTPDVEDDSVHLKVMEYSSISSSSSTSSSGLYDVNDQYSNGQKDLVKQESLGENVKKLCPSRDLLNLCRHVKQKSQELFSTDTIIKRSRSYTASQLRLPGDAEIPMSSDLFIASDSTSSNRNGSFSDATTRNSYSSNSTNKVVASSGDQSFHGCLMDSASNNMNPLDADQVASDISAIDISCDQLASDFRNCGCTYNCDCKDHAFNDSTAKSMIRNNIGTNNMPSGPPSHDLKLGSMPHDYLDRSKSSCTELALESLRFISKTTESDLAPQWKAVEDRFYEVASPDGLINRHDFGYCIGMNDSHEFASELFDALSRRRGLVHQYVTLEELENFWTQISNQSFNSRIQIFFDMCDKNGDGRITEEEVKEVIALSASANNLSKLRDQAEESAALIMEEFDPHNLGYIELWQFKALLQDQDCQLSGQDTTSNHSQALSQTPAPKKGSNLLHRMSLAAAYALDENWQQWWVMGLWIMAMAGLFTWKFLQYRMRTSFQIMGYCVCTAKGAAETLKLNMALILLPVCRNCITWLRSTVLSSIIPFDDNINFHKAIAAAIAVGVIMHAGIHMACDFPRLIHSDDEKFKRYLGSDFDFAKPTYPDLVKGVEGLTGMAMVVVMVIAFVLASRWFRRNLVKLPWPLHRMTGFNAFWYSHHLFVILYVLLIIHSQYLYLNHDWRQKTTWIYLAVPVLLYTGERLLRALRAGYYSVTVVKAAIYPGNVLALEMAKPPGFKYKSGMYIFLQCPDVSPFEWHPFSLTSAPGDDVISVHIRTCGDWTLEMKRIFSEIMEPPLPGGSGLLRAECKFGSEIRFPRLRIDGPYGAPAQDYKKYDVLLLVGLGIGATPFISVLKDMLNNLKLADQHSTIHDSSTSISSSNSSITSLESASTIKSSSDGGPNVRKSKKWRCPTNAYFYWVTREQGSLEWFRGVMNEVAEKDYQAVIEMHNYLTSVYEDGDARSALIMMIQRLHHAKNGVDIVSGTRVRTHFARPNWKKVFSRVASIHKGSRIGVFYCGPLMAAKELENLVKDYNHFSSTRFEFHKENF